MTFIYRLVSRSSETLFDALRAYALRALPDRSVARLSRVSFPELRQICFFSAALRASFVVIILFVVFLDAGDHGSQNCRNPAPLPEVQGRI